MAETSLPPRKKCAINSAKLTLSAPCPTAKGKWSQLKWDLYMGNPRVVVRTNDPSDMEPSKSYGVITAALDTPTFYSTLVLLEQAIASPADWRAKVENYNHSWTDGKKDENISHLTDLWIGKDKEGCVFMSVVSKKDDRPVIKFPFGPADARYHKIYHSDGTEYSRAEISVLYAQAYLRLLNDLVSNLLVSEYVEPPARTFTPGGNNTSGGYRKPYQNNSGGGNGGGYQPRAAAPAADVPDEDMPF